MSDHPVVELSDVSYRYRTEGPETLEHVSLSVGPRDFLGVIGPNGGGKTTLLKIVLGLLRPTQGTVKVFGESPQQVGTRIGYVPQQARIDISIPATVLDVVLMGRLSRHGWGPAYRSEDRAAAMAALEETAVADLADRSMGSLSGGQRQRVLLARAVCGGAELLLLDEPMAGVDVHMQKELLDLLRRLHARMPVIMISHDMAYVSTRCNRVACLNRSMDLHEATEVTTEIISDMYHGDVRWIRHAHGCEHDHDHSHHHHHDGGGEVAP